MSFERVGMLLRAFWWRALARIKILLLMAAIYRKAHENRAAALDAISELRGINTRSLGAINSALRTVNFILPGLSNSGVVLTVRMELLVGDILEALVQAKSYMALVGGASPKRRANPLLKE